jgi:hypothetical protein
VTRFLELHPGGAANLLLGAGIAILVFVQPPTALVDTVFDPRGAQTKTNKQKMDFEFDEDLINDYEENLREPEPEIDEPEPPPPPGPPARSCWRTWSRAALAYRRRRRLFRASHSPCRASPKASGSPASSCWARPRRCRRGCALPRCAR